MLKWLAVTGITAGGGIALIEDAPWLNFEHHIEQTWQPLQPSTTPTAQIRELVRYATLAANGHNTQPWMFAIRDHTIEIHPDYSRRLRAVDPDDRELWISLGCALENLLIAARATGYTAEVTYPDATDVIAVRLTPETAQPSPLFDAIPLRQTTRSPYDGRAVSTADLMRLEAIPLEPGVTLRFALHADDLTLVSEYIGHGNLRQYADTAFIAELVSWLRFNKKEALASRDGLYAGSSGNPDVPRWLGKMFLASTKPQQQASADTKKLETSSGAIVLAAQADDKPSWVRTGQVYERLALTTTALDIKSAFLNQPIEVPVIRGQFQRAFGLGSALPQLLVRFGYAHALPRSLRRPIEQVLI